MKRHHLTLPPDGNAVVAILEDEAGVVHHVTIQAPAERRALLASVDGSMPGRFGEARDRNRSVRATVEARVFAMAERQHLAPAAAPTPAPVKKKPAKKKVAPPVKSTKRTRGR